MPTATVYFIRAETMGLIKIGRAAHLQSRFRNIQVNSPDEVSIVGAILTDRAEVIEGDIHRIFAKDRVRGEWFKPSPALLKMIAAHTLETYQASWDRLLLEAVGEPNPMTEEGR